MNPFLILGILGGIVTAGTQIQAGRERRRRAEEDAINAEIERKQSEISAIEQQNARLRDFAEASSVNDAWFAYAGRGKDDQSVRSFMDYNRSIAHEDVSRIASTSLIRSIQLDKKASNLRRAGAYYERAGNATAFSTIISTGMNVKRSM
tara:strand:+ start:87 stop:533 length:447 start_codon:yes stop_codon:yes gene_type:complete